MHNNIGLYVKFILYIKLKTKILYIYRFTYIATLGCNPSTDINSFRLRIDGKISNSCTGVNYINANHKQTNLSVKR